MAGPSPARMREEGVFLGALVVNLAVTEGLLLVVSIVFSSPCWPPTGPLTRPPS
ncbi:MAG: hypothetical protein ACRD1K_12670 [Acidimicrobiales bacterium]